MSPSDSPSITTVTIGVALTAILLLAFAFIPHSSGSRGEGGGNDGAFNRDWFFAPKLSLTQAQVTESRDNFYPIVYLSAEEVRGKEISEKLVQAYRKANEQHFDTKRSDIEQSIVIYADEWFETVENMESFVHIGDALFQACDDALARLLPEIEHYSLKDHQLPEKVLKSEELDAYRSYCGDAIPLLLSYGLVRKGQWSSPISKMIFDALQRSRFQQVVASRVPPSRGLSPADQLLIAWWKTMMPEAFPARVRKQYLGVLSDELPESLTNPSSPFFFNTTRAEALINYQNAINEGISEEIAERLFVKTYQEACKNRRAPAQTQDACRWLSAHSLSTTSSH